MYTYLYTVCVAVWWPCSIKDDTIDGLTVKLQLNQGQQTVQSHMLFLLYSSLLGKGAHILCVGAEAKWTKAMKYLLINLKFLLAWTAKHKPH